VIDQRAEELAAYLGRALERRSRAWWHAGRRYELRRFAGDDVPRLGTADHLQLLSALNAVRPVGMAPVIGPELAAYLLAAGADP
jgi:hypothetical protein